MATAPTSKTKTPMTSAQVREAMIRKLEGSALDLKDAKALQTRPYTAEEAKALKLPATKAGFLIPYFDLKGKPLRFFRFRYMEDTRKGFQAAAKVKALRYAQPKDSTVELYLPPLVKWEGIAADPEVPVLITEGELKAACATKHGIPTIGLGGVWSFQSKPRGEAIVKGFADFDWEGRTVFICYDSDGATNPDVVNAESRLAQRLVEKGAVVFICRIPVPDHSASEEGEESLAPKVGLDDYIVAHGVDSLRSQVLDTAFEYDASAALHKLNERVLYVRDPGLIWDHSTRMRMAPSAFKEHAFSNLHYFEKRVDKKGNETLTKVSAAKAWLEWEHRAEVPGVSFAPGQDRITELGKLNSWTGWGVPEPEEGNIDPWVSLLDHIFADDHAARRYFEQWAAWPLQNPGGKMHVACAIWGPVHGSGKTLMGAMLRRIYGNKHSTELKDADLEDARFEWAENQQFVLADDITARGDRKFMRKLMTMITQYSMRMNPKYIPSYVIEDCINYYYTSNDPDALFMDDEDRRFFVHEVRAGKLKNTGWYVDWMKSASGTAALWHHLLHIDMTGFDPHAPAPSTVGKQQMIELGKSELGAWVHELKTNTDQILAKGKMKGDIFSIAELHMLFDPHGDKRASANALARELKRAGFSSPATGNKLRMPDGKQITAYSVRNTDKWDHCAWKEACDHYIEHHPDLTAKPVGKKF